MTVRRDIQLLEEEGKVIAINGGVKLNNLLKSELPWREKAELHHDRAGSNALPRCRHLVV